MIYEMRVRPQIYEYILNGTKRIEMRIFDEKRKKLKIGDKILFKDHFNYDKNFLTTITEITLYSNFEELIDNNNMEKIWTKNSSKEELLNELNKYYTIEEQKENGVVAIKFELD